MKTFTVAISFIQPLFRTVEEGRPVRHGLCHPVRAYRLQKLPFKDAEPVNEVNHEVTTQRIVFRILCIVSCYALRDITALLLQDIINFETQCRLVPFQERFGCGCIP